MLIWSLFISCLRMSFVAHLHFPIIQDENPLETIFSVPPARRHSEIPLCAMWLKFVPMRDHGCNANLSRNATRPATSEKAQRKPWLWNNSSQPLHWFGRRRSSIITFWTGHIRASPLSSSSFFDISFSQYSHSHISIFPWICCYIQFWLGNTNVGKWIPDLSRIGIAHQRI